MSRGDIIFKTQDLTYLTWEECGSPSGLGGASPKAREGTGANAVYYKRSASTLPEQGNRDLLAQLIGARLLDALGFEHVPFQLVHAAVTGEAHPMWIAKSKSYRRLGERAIDFDLYQELCGEPSATPLEFSCSHGWELEAVQVLLFDYLTATRSRDSSCFEVLISRDGVPRLSPVVLCSLSLANAFPLGSYRRDPLADVGAAGFLGSASLAENLGFVRDALGFVKQPSGLKRKLLAGLENVVSDVSFVEGCWSIIEARWAEYARFCRL